MNLKPLSNKDIFPNDLNISLCFSTGKYKNIEVVGNLNIVLWNGKQKETYLPELFDAFS